METERIALSQRERDRLRVLQDVQQGHLTQVEAAVRVKLSDRQVRRLLVRIGEQGDRAVIHGLRGPPSNRRLAAPFEQKILARLRQRYADFGPTLAAEHLAKDGFRLSRETLRKWMTKADLWRPRSRRVKVVHVWRERRASFGELVMQDSSPFRWLEERGPACQLIALIDDATSRIWARFTEHDTTEENLRTLQGWLRRYGRPLAHYTDQNSIFRTTRPSALGSSPAPLPAPLPAPPSRSPASRASEPPARCDSPPAHAPDNSTSLRSPQSSYTAEPPGPLWIHAFRCSATLRENPPSHSPDRPEESRASRPSSWLENSSAPPTPAPASRPQPARNRRRIFAPESSAAKAVP